MKNRTPSEIADSGEGQPSPSGQIAAFVGEGHEVGRERTQARRVMKSARPMALAHELIRCAGINPVLVPWMVEKFTAAIEARDREHAGMVTPGVAGPPAGYSKCLNKNCPHWKPDVIQWCSTCFTGDSHSSMLIGEPNWTPAAPAPAPEVADVQRERDEAEAHVRALVNARIRFAPARTKALAWLVGIDGRLSKFASEMRGRHILPAAAPAVVPVDAEGPWICAECGARNPPTSGRCSACGYIIGPVATPTAAVVPAETPPAKEDSNG